MSILSWGKFFGKAGKLVTSTAEVGGKATVAGLKTAGKIGEQVFLHPGRTAAATFGAYSGWQYLMNDKSALETGKDVLDKSKDFLIGDKGKDAINRSETLNGTASPLGNALSTATGVVGQAWSGLGNSIGSLFNGNAGTMLSNFASNLFNGRVEGLGVIGLLYSATLIFGRHSLLSKLAGAMLAMSIIGSHAGLGMTQAQQLGQQQDGQQLRDNYQDAFDQTEGRSGIRR